MANTSFIPRRIQVHLTLNKGSFGGEGNSKVIDCLATKCTVEKLGPPDFAKASVEITGLQRDDIELLTTLNFIPIMTQRHYINIYAGDDVMGLSEIFAGSIISASGDYDSCPDIKFKLEAEVGFWGRVYPQGPSVMSSPVSAESFISSMAGMADMTFTNEGVTASLKRGDAFTGSPVEQARQAANKVGAELLIDDDEMILIPKNTPRQGTMPLIDRDSGLLGYASISANGIEFKSIFNPAYRFAGLVELKSTVPKTSGIWRIVKLTHKLCANEPKDGSWISEITGFYPEMSGEIGKFI